MAAEFEVRGRFAYGLLKGEKGTHRLVRTNPLKNTGTRETSFAGVEVMPLLDDNAAGAIEVPEGDLEITTMRAGGAGGQASARVAEPGHAGVCETVPWLLRGLCAVASSALAQRAIARASLPHRT